MICARPGCGKPTGTNRDGTPRKYCSQTCNVLRNRPVLRVVITVDQDYTMTCLHCDEKYDGRTGPWVGLCSLRCVGAHAMGQAADRVRASA